MIPRETSLRWLLGFGCFATVIFFFSPSWGAFSLWSRVPEMGGMMEVRRGVSVLAQVAAPGAEIPDPLHSAIQWRLLFPVVGNLLHLSPALLFGLAHVGCVIVLAYLVTLLRREGFGWSQAYLGSVAIGAGSWFFVSTGWLGYYDSWLALALLLVAFANRSWTVWAACLWAPWIDERFVMAVPLALLCRWIRHATQPAGVSASPFAWRREFGVPAALITCFLIVRLGFLANSSAAGATLGGYFTGKDYLDAPLSRILLGVWEGLRAGWFFIIAAVLLLRRSPVWSAALGGAVVVMIAAGLFTAQDYSRSMTMLLPVGVMGLMLTGRHWASRATSLLGAATAAALLLPAHHVMSDGVNPIFYLYHELAALHSPPPAAMPEVRELNAIHAMDRGDFATAERELTLAVKVAANPASPAKQRGVLYAKARRWEEAKHDFSLVVEHDPENPDGWFLRAQAELALRNPDAARSDFDHAKAVAPPGWADRTDVQRFSEVFSQHSAKR